MNANSIKLSERALFYKLFANLLAAGFSPVESLSRLMQEPLSQRLRTPLQPLLATLPPTASLVDCLKLKAFALDATTLNLFEKTARLEDHISLLQALSARYSQASWINQLRGNSLNWPLTCFFIGSGVIAVLFYRVLPSFAKFYEDMGGMLPKETSFLLAYGFEWLLLLLLMALVLLALYVRPTPLRTLIDRLCLIRPWGVLSEKIALTRFTHMLALLLSNNTTPRHALIMATTATENVVIEHRLQSAFAETAVSHTFDTSSSIASILKTCPLVPGAFVATLDIAEKTQRLEDTLPELTEMSASLLSHYTQILNNVVYAVSLALVGLLIGLTVIAIYKPIFSMGALI
jgi:type IV pilus assembly protein PilC